MPPPPRPSRWRPLSYRLSLRSTMPSRVHPSYHRNVPPPTVLMYACSLFPLQSLYRRPEVIAVARLALQNHFRSMPFMPEQAASEIPVYRAIRISAGIHFYSPLCHPPMPGGSWLSWRLRRRPILLSRKSPSRSPSPFQGKSATSYPHSGHSHTGTSTPRLPSASAP